jgi:hypothetical protein
VFEDRGHRQITKGKKVYEVIFIDIRRQKMSKKTLSLFSHPTCILDSKTGKKKKF